MDALPRAAPPTAAAPDVDRRAVDAAIRATYAAFIANGFAFATWASRIPQVKERLDLTPSELGLVLLAIAVGSVLALPLSGPVVAPLRLAPDGRGDGGASAASALVVVAARLQVGVAAGRRRPVR